MTHPPARHSSHSPTFTTFQILILTLCAGLICLLAGVFGYVLWSQTASAPPAVQAKQVLSTFTPTSGRAVRALPPTITPQSGPPWRATPTHTPGLPTPVPPQACIPSTAEIQTGIVVAVLDGERIEVEIDGQILTVSYAGIQAPPDSIVKNSELVAGKSVVLVKDTAESVEEQGQMRRYVLAGDRFINYEMVRQGYAQALDATSLDAPALACDQVFHQAEDQARADQLVLWAPTQIPTLTFVPTVGSNPSDLAGCNCTYRWACSDFSSQARAQSCFNACNDYNSRLDEDHDGLACENLP